MNTSALSKTIPETSENTIAHSNSFLSLFKQVKKDESNKLLQLFNERDEKKNKLSQMSEVFKDQEYKGLVNYFITGNTKDDYHRYNVSRLAGELFDLEGALKSLDASYWSKAMTLTDVYDVMPEKRRDEWNDKIRNHDTEPFTANIVIPTLQEFLQSRLKFLAERVDGIFRGLSGVHVTNSSYGFSKRMIMNTVIESYGCVNHTKAGLINDLRSVLSKFMGRGDIHHSSTYLILSEIGHETGVWHELDGGALRLKLFKKGTGHLEVHPDMAWRLNDVLATLYPKQIPSENRKPSRKQYSQPIKTSLHFDVLNCLSDLCHWGKSNRCSFRREKETSQSVIQQVIELLEGLGANYNNGTFHFPYECRPVINQIIMSGCVPEKQSHQFYPTPKVLAEHVIEHAGIQDGDKCLEPSAGLGALAELMPADTDCVELSELHCKVLSEKGLRAINDDFLKWSTQTSNRYDRIVMNPPYAKGQALSHLTAALSVLKKSGSVVAILPASMRGREFPGFCCTWSEVLEDQFKDAGVRVVIGCFDKV
ncbi:DUF4942 domain-containing protein [Endozoicomonas sp. ONNA1]|uniref:DUF4942 domain-containing protein n=1 Tax=Endozoicomonas sp. ONNA1 TaxID=2828740 RepID=UPI002148A05C|nr:DUF4942 domain-containing protein [Endozoicomonas sp. ONNA1]